MTLEIKEVKSGKSLKRFIQFPNSLYREDPNYVPALHISVKWMLSKRNPFLKHSRIALFVAYEDKKPVGRIAAIYNTPHLEKYNDNTGFFGFFDCVDNKEIAGALFNASHNWLKERGILRMVGPTNLTTNDSCGILIEGFEYPPMVLMPYNFEYYDDLCRSYGMVKEMDLYSYYIEDSSGLDRFISLASRAQKTLNNNNICIRPLSKKHFNDDIKKLREVYNKCNENNWGFIPLNEDEFYEMAKDLIRITSHDLSILVEKEGKLIGFIISVPDINQALKFLKNGKLFPLGFVKLLRYRRGVNNARVLILGLLEEFKGRGIDLLMYNHIKEALKKHNITRAEACYVLENNYQMNSILKKINGRYLKKYRLYQVQ